MTNFDNTYMSIWIDQCIALIQSYFFNDISNITEILFSGSVVFLAIVVIAYISIFTKRKNKPQAYWLLLVFSLLALILVIYNPIIKSLINEWLPYTQANVDTVYSRFWILCPLWIVIAYAVASADKHKNRNFKHIIAVASSLLIVLFGQNITSNAMLIDSGNQYKIDDQAVLISDAVLSANDGNPAHLLVFVPYHDTYERFVTGGTVYYGITQYTGLIEAYPLYYKEEQWEDWFLSEMTPEGEWTIFHIEYFLKQTYYSSVEYISSENNQQWHPDYVAMPAAQSITEKMEALGCVYVGQAGEYNIYSLSSAYK